MAEACKQVSQSAFAVTPSTTGRERTTKACVRCRRQKLKCDAQKPCTLCTRAGTECENAAEYSWKIQTQTAHRSVKKRKRKQAHSGDVPTSNSPFEPSTNSGETLNAQEADALNGNVRDPIVQVAKHGVNGQNSHLGNEVPDSSALNLVREAFDFHQSGELPMTATSSLPRGRASAIVDPSQNTTGAVSLTALNIRSLTTKELLDLLPKRQEALKLLIDTYFDRVHWFMLAFHQETFRERFQKLVSQQEKQPANSTEDFSFTCTVLTVATLGLQYTCSYRKECLVQMNVEPETLLTKLLSTIQSVLFDLIAIGSLESIQVCILIGSFYLFHGCPGPALPVIGCGLRIAQGMGLHRTSVRQGFGDRDDAKRCWLALFEVDRFCSMVYGLPISFANEDCDIERWKLLPSPTSTPDRVSVLLYYKGYMSELSIIMTEVLQELYAPDPRPRRDRPAVASSSDSHTQILSGKIRSLDQKLRDWYGSVSYLLRLQEAEPVQRAYASPEAMAHDVGGSGEPFERHVLRMQAVTLKLAFENGIIMIHRPLLSFRAARSFQSQPGQDELGNEMPNPFQSSIDKCCRAALNTAAIGSCSAFDEGLDTYAVSFMAIHVFTAGIVLCLIASFEPMTLQAHGAKTGIQKLLVMQRKLQERSVVAAQGLKLLEKVVALILNKELQAVLGSAKPDSSSSVHIDKGALLASASISRPGQTSDSEGYGMGADPNRESQRENEGLFSDRAGNSISQIHIDGPALSQVQGDINSDPSIHEFINAASDPYYSMESYDPLQSAFSMDIEQGWIWDPDWLVRM